MGELEDCIIKGFYLSYWSIPRCLWERVLRSFFLFAQHYKWYSFHSTVKFQNSVKNFKIRWEEGSLLQLFYSICAFLLPLFFIYNYMGLILFEFFCSILSLTFCIYSIIAEFLSLKNSLKNLRTFFWLIGFSYEPQTFLFRLLALLFRYHLKFLKPFYIFLSSKLYIFL